MFLEHINYNVGYEKLITKQIINYIWINIFEEIFNLLKSNVVYNNNSKLQDALQSGRVYFQDGVFYSVKGSFTNDIAKELELMNCRYSYVKKGYVKDVKTLPVDIKWAIDTANARTAEKVTGIVLFLGLALRKMQQSKELINFNDNVNLIMSDLQNKFYKNAEKQKFELIIPKLTEFQKTEIAKNYTNNLNFWVEDWTETEILKLRAEVQSLITAGKGLKSIEQYILKEFSVSQRKAAFLARNETTILQASYQESKLKEEGFTHFRWVSKQDESVRPLHKELNGNVFSFDNLPIVDEKTGQRGLPGQTYNCRCIMDGYANKEFFENRKKMFKINNSLIGKLKKCLKNR